MLLKFDKGPFPELHNTICTAIYPSEFEINKRHYAINNSQNISTTIGQQVWQSTMTRKKLKTSHFMTD